MYITDAINRYKQATKDDTTNCCAIAGSNEGCKECPNYKFRVNKITMNLIKTEITEQGLDKEYYPLWQEILTISNEMNKLGLSLSNLDLTEDNLKKVTTVLERSKKAIANLEIKKTAPKKGR